MDKNQESLNLEAVVDFVIKNVDRMTRDEIIKYINQNLYSFTKR